MEVGFGPIGLICNSQLYKGTTDPERGRIMLRRLLGIKKKVTPAEVAQHTYEIFIQNLRWERERTPIEVQKFKEAREYFHTFQPKGHRKNFSHFTVKGCKIRNGEVEIFWMNEDVNKIAKKCYDFLSRGDVKFDANRRTLLMILSECMQGSYRLSILEFVVRLYHSFKEKGFVS